MIIRITFEDLEGEEYRMMFGDSYKGWKEQVEEYLRSYVPNKYNEGCVADLLEVEVCNEKWIGWGGLKWCNANEFQKELNREGVQDHEPDNPEPRRYGKMRFYHDPKIDESVRKSYLDIKLKYS